MPEAVSRIGKFLRSGVPRSGPRAQASGPGCPGLGPVLGRVSEDRANLGRAGRGIAGQSKRIHAKLRNCRPNELEPEPRDRTPKKNKHPENENPLNLRGTLCLGANLDVKLRK